MKFFILLLLVTVTYTAGAQNLKALLDRKKLEAKAKADFKTDIKTSEVIDSAIAAPDAVLRKAKDKKAAKRLAKGDSSQLQQYQQDPYQQQQYQQQQYQQQQTQQQYQQQYPQQQNQQQYPQQNQQQYPQQAPPSTPQPADGPEGTTLVIETNIRCDEGKQKMEAKFRKQPSVLEITVDTTSGDLSIRFRSASLNYITIVEMINNAGFVADDKQPASNAPANPCAKQK